VWSPALFAVRLPLTPDPPPQQLWMVPRLLYVTAVLAVIAERPAAIDLALALPVTIRAAQVPGVLYQSQLGSTSSPRGQVSAKQDRQRISEIRQRDKSSPHQQNGERIVGHSTSPFMETTVG